MVLVPAHRRGPLSPAGLPIAEASRRTGLPVTTLRFYERELPGLFTIRKTRGGHRRYAERDVERFAAVRRLTREGARLSEVRRILMSPGENEALRERVDFLLDVHGTEARALDDILHRLSELEERIARLEGPPSLRRGWFRDRRRR